MKFSVTLAICDISFACMCLCGKIAKTHSIKGVIRRVYMNEHHIGGCRHIVYQKSVSHFCHSQRLEFVNVEFISIQMVGYGIIFLLRIFHTTKLLSVIFYAHRFHVLRWKKKEIEKKSQPICDYSNIFDRFFHFFSPIQSKGEIEPDTKQSPWIL